MTILEWTDVTELNLKFNHLFIFKLMKSRWKEFTKVTLVFKKIKKKRNKNNYILIWRKEWARKIGLHQRHNQLCT